MEQGREALEPEITFMRRLLILTVTLMFGVNCASSPTSQMTNAAVSESAATPSQRPTPTKVGKDGLEEPEKKQDIPPEFIKTDFRNFSYPTSFRRKSIELKDGTYEFPNRNGAGGDRFDLMDVSYGDLTRSGHKEAVVRLGWVSCGGSCNGGSELFYFYSRVNGKLSLLSRIETGSQGYDCGLKSFELKKQILTLETFRACRFNGLAFTRTHDQDETGGKFLTNRFTHFILRFTGTRFVLIKRTVFAYPEEDFRSYEPKIEISDE
jgi:hypothetical protein